MYHAARALPYSRTPVSIAANVPVLLPLSTRVQRKLTVLNGFYVWCYSSFFLLAGVDVGICGIMVACKSAAKKKQPLTSL